MIVGFSSFCAEENRTTNDHGGGGGGGVSLHASRGGALGRRGRVAFVPTRFRGGGVGALFEAVGCE